MNAGSESQISPNYSQNMSTEQLDLVKTMVDDMKDVPLASHLSEVDPCMIDE